MFSAEEKTAAVQSSECDRNHEVSSQSLVYADQGKTWRLLHLAPVTNWCDNRIESFQILNLRP